MSTDLVRACIGKAIKQSPSGFPRSMKLKEVGESVLAKTAEPEKCKVFDEFCSKLVEWMMQEISTTCKRLKSSSSKRSRLWCNFHKIRSDPQGHPILLWKKLMEDLTIAAASSINAAEGDEDPLLMQAVLKWVFEECITKYFMKDKKDDLATSSERAPDEMNALRFACGYVGHSLLKKFEEQSMLSL